MFLPTMKDDEIYLEAKKDFDELAVKIHVERNNFKALCRKVDSRRHNMPPIVKTKKFITHQHNEWRVLFRSESFIGDEMNYYYIAYHPIYRESGIEYLFSVCVEDYMLEYLTTHFLQRYKERCLAPQGLNLSGANLLTYFYTHTVDRCPAKNTRYLESEKVIDKAFFWMFGQGILVTKLLYEHFTTYITFIDVSSLTDFKSEYYDEVVAYKKYAAIMDNLDKTNVRNDKKLCGQVSALFSNSEFLHNLSGYFRRRGTGEKYIASVLKVIEGYAEQAMEAEKSESCFHPKHDITIGFVKVAEYISRASIDDVCSFMAFWQNNMLGYMQYERNRILAEQ